MLTYCGWNKTNRQAIKLPKITTFSFNASSSKRNILILKQKTLSKIFIALSPIKLKKKD